MEDDKNLEGENSHPKINKRIQWFNKPLDINLDRKETVGVKVVIKTV